MATVMANALAATTQQLAARSGGGSPAPDRPPAFKAVGIALAIASGVFIGISFVMKKMGLLKANVKYNEEAGEGYGYLKNAWWWGGMTLMIIGEVCNFVAYAFVDAILVTPLGALSVVVTTILSAIFLKERLSFVGKVACFICIIGSIVIVLNAPAQSTINTIQDMQHFVIHPLFLTYAGVVIVGCLFVIFWVAPRYGKKSMMVYLTVCSLIGGLSVVATQGLGAAVVAQARGTPQFNQWFLYVLLVFVIATLLTEIIYLNKALNIFNAALVTPTYYVYFTSATIVSSAILFRGFKGSPQSIITIVMGFLQICAGVVLLQLSKSAKDVPDAAVLAGDLDQMRTVAEQEQPESEPKADAIRGTAAIIRRLSQSRQKMEAEEAKRVYEDRMRDTMEPIGENEQVQWDGVRRRKTVRLDPEEIQRRKSMHPPLGLTKFPSYDEDEATREHAGTPLDRFFSFRRRGTSASTHLAPPRTPSSRRPTGSSPLPQDDKELRTDTLETIPSAQDDVEMHGMPTEQRLHANSGTSARTGDSSNQGRPIAWAGNNSSDFVKSPKTARRAFSFQNFFAKSPTAPSPSPGPGHIDGARSPRSRPGTSRSNQTPKVKNATEEELYGLVRGDSDRRSEDNNSASASDDEGKGPDPNLLHPHRPRMDTAPSEPLPTRANQAKELEAYEMSAKRWGGGAIEVKSPGGGRPLPKTPTEEEDEVEGGGGFESRLKVRPLDILPRRPRGGNGNGDGNGNGGGEGSGSGRGDPPKYSS